MLQISYVVSGSMTVTMLLVHTGKSRAADLVHLCQHGKGLGHCSLSLDGSGALFWTVKDAAQHLQPPKVSE